MTTRVTITPIRSWAYLALTPADAGPTVAN